MEMLKRSPLSPGVIHAIKEVRNLPWRRGSVSPFQLAFNLNFERAAIPARYLSRHLINSGKTFFCPAMKAQSARTREESYVRQRPHIVSMLMNPIQGRNDGRMILDGLLQELIVLRGSPGDSLCSAISETIEQLDVYICLSASIVLWHLDVEYSPDWSPLQALESARRQPGESLLSFISQIELLT